MNTLERKIAALREDIKLKAQERERQAAEMKADLDATMAEIERLESLERGAQLDRNQAYRRQRSFQNDLARHGADWFFA